MCEDSGSPLGSSLQECLQCISKLIATTRMLCFGGQTNQPTGVGLRLVIWYLELPPIIQKTGLTLVTLSTVIKSVSVKFLTLVGHFDISQNWQKSEGDNSYSPL